MIEILNWIANALMNMSIRIGVVCVLAVLVVTIISLIIEED